jgi:hypothetical protein
VIERDGAAEDAAIEKIWNEAAIGGVTYSGMFKAGVKFERARNQAKMGEAMRLLEYARGEIECANALSEEHEEIQNEWLADLERLKNGP